MTLHTTPWLAHTITRHWSEMIEPASSESVVTSTAEEGET